MLNIGENRQNEDSESCQSILVDNLDSSLFGGMISGTNTYTLLEERSIGGNACIEHNRYKSELECEKLSGDQDNQNSI